MSSRTFVRDDGETSVEVDYSASGGSAPSGMSGPPEYYDPGSGFEVVVEGAWDAAGNEVKLTDAEYERLEREVNEDPETWEPDDGPDDWERD